MRRGPGHRAGQGDGGALEAPSMMRHWRPKLGDSVSIGADSEGVRVPRSITFTEFPPGTGVSQGRNGAGAHRPQAE
jgi:hypothetical protein